MATRNGPNTAYRPLINKHDCSDGRHVAEFLRGGDRDTDASMARRPGGHRATAVNSHAFNDVVSEGTTDVRSGFGFFSVLSLASPICPLDETKHRDAAIARLPTVRRHTRMNCSLPFVNVRHLTACFTSPQSADQSLVRVKRVQLTHHCDLHRRLTAHGQDCRLATSRDRFSTRCTLGV